MLTKLSARKLLTHTGQIDYPIVTTEDGQIATIESGLPNGSTETLTAAFFDQMLVHRLNDTCFRVPRYVYQLPKAHPWLGHFPISTRDSASYRIWRRFSVEQQYDNSFH